MKYAYLGILVMLLAVGYLMFSPAKNEATPYVEPTPTVIDLDSYKIFELVNEYRTSKGLGKLVFDPKLCPLAEKRLEQIHTDWSHDKFKDTRYQFFSIGTVGENLAKDYVSEQETVDEWIMSPSHLDNIADPLYTNTCVVDDKVKNTTYTVQIFSNF